MIDNELPRSGAGRPSGSDGDRVRDSLLQAARALFLSNEFKAVSIRQIAAAANVNGAMVSYYFGGKQGLYLAMVEDVLESLEQSLEALHPGTEFTIEEFSHSYCLLLAANPWWPNFVVREVLFSEGEIKQAVIQKFATSFAPRLITSIHKGMAGGQFRDNLDPAMMLLSLMGMTIFPFLAKPMVEQVLNIKVDADFASRYASHNTQLFLHGVHAASAGAALEKNP